MYPSILSRFLSEESDTSARTKTFVRVSTLTDERPAAARAMSAAIRRCMPSESFQPIVLLSLLIEMTKGITTASAMGMKIRSQYGLSKLIFFIAIYPPIRNKENRKADKEDLKEAYKDFDNRVAFGGDIELQYIDGSLNGWSELFSEASYVIINLGDRHLENIFRGCMNIEMAKLKLGLMPEIEKPKELV